MKVLFTILSLAGAIVCGILSQKTFSAIRREVNQASPPDQEYTLFEWDTVAGTRLLKRHKALYPDSPLRHRLEALKLISYAFVLAVFLINVKYN